MSASGSLKKAFKGLWFVVCGLWFMRVRAIGLKVLLEV